MNSRGEVTFFKILMSVLLVILFIAGFSLFNLHQAETYGTLEQSNQGINMTNIFYNLTGNESGKGGQLADISSASEELKNATMSLGEAQSVIFAITTIEGFTSAMLKLLTSSIAFMMNVISIVVTGFPIPPIVTAILFIAITILIVYAGIRAIVGRNI